MKDVYIVAAARTAIGKMGGTLKGVQPEELARVVLEALPQRAGIRKSDVESIVFAQARQSTDAANLGRVAALMAGYPESIPAFTIMMQCSSGMQAVHTAADQIRCGHADVVVAGGVESMSNAIFYIRNARYGLGVGTTELVDSITEGQLRSQPIDIYGKFNMGDTAENVAEKYGISREDQDAFAAESQRRAAKALADGVFKDEIVPVVIPVRKGDPIVFDVDEYPRPSSTVEALAKLKPVFRRDGKGSVTAGNACGRNDGAAAMVLMSGEKVKELGVKPLARIVSQASAGVDPRYMGIGPVAASRKALEKAGLTAADIGRVELNEAFASQSLACVRELGFDPAIVNVNGGAIALGHPLGATGARIITTLIYEMQRSNTRYGLASLCVAGGLGCATIVEKV